MLAKSTFVCAESIAFSCL